MAFSTAVRGRAVPRSLLAARIPTPFGRRTSTGEVEARRGGGRAGPALPGRRGARPRRPRVRARHRRTAPDHRSLHTTAAGAAPSSRDGRAPAQLGRADPAGHHAAAEDETNGAIAGHPRSVGGAPVVRDRQTATGAARDPGARPAGEDCCRTRAARAGRCHHRARTAPAPGPHQPTRRPLRGPQDLHRPCRTHESRPIGDDRAAQGWSRLSGRGPRGSTRTPSRSGRPWRRRPR